MVKKTKITKNQLLPFESSPPLLRKHNETSLEPTGSEKEEENESFEGKEAENDEDFAEISGQVVAIRRRRAEGRVSRISDDEKPLAATKTLVKNVSMEEKPNENDESSEREEEDSTDEELSEDSGDSKNPNDPKQEVSSTSSSSDSGSEDGEEESKELNSRAELTHLQLSPPQPARKSANPIADSLLKPPDSSKTVDGEEEEDDSEEEESVADEESTEDFHNTAAKENPPAQRQDSQNVDDDRQASSSGSGLLKDEDIETPIPDRFLEPLSNKPIESSAQSAEKEPNSWKQDAIFPAKFSKKKRSAGIVRAGRGQKKELFKRIWSNEDELILLQGIMEYKERHHAIPHTLVHTDSILKSVKDSLSTSFTANQLNDKVRRMRKRYNNTNIRQIHAKKSKFSDPHNAAVFDLSKKIWDSRKEDSILFADKITLEKKDEDISREYPSLCWLLRNEHAKNALTLQNLIPIASAKQFEKKCKELEMMDIQLNMQKMEFLSSAVKLIKDALPKS